MRYRTLFFNQRIATVTDSRVTVIFGSFLSWSIRTVNLVLYSANTVYWYTRHLIHCNKSDMRLLSFGVFVFLFAFTVYERPVLSSRDESCCNAPEVTVLPSDPRPHRMAFILGAQKSGVAKKGKKRSHPAKTFN